VRLRNIILGLLGSVALILEIAGPAMATSGTICTSFGNHYCVGSDDLNYGTSIESKVGGRNVTYNGPIGTEGVISLNGGTDKCIKTVSNDYTLKIGHCSDTGTLWVELDNGDGTRYWLNHHTGYYMACDNTLNDVCVARPLGASGWYYKMEPL
jgi:hypothetical protein